MLTRTNFSTFRSFSTYTVLSNREQNTGEILTPQYLETDPNRTWKLGWRERAICTAECNTGKLFAIRTSS